MHNEDGAPIPSDDLLPDEVLAKHIGGTVETDAHEDEIDTPNPAARSRAPRAVATDTPEDDDWDLEGDEFEDTDEDEAGEDEPVDREDDEDLETDEDDLDDEDDLEDDEDLDGDEDEEADEDTGKKKPTRGEKGLLDELPKFDRKKLESAIRADKSGELGKAYKHLQALATRKTTEASTLRTEAKQLRADFDAFNERVATPEGARDFLTDVVMHNPAVAAAAFEAVAMGERAVDFLVEVGLSKPDLIEQAFDRVQELHQDPDARARHTRERETSQRDEQLRRREQRLETVEQQRTERRITRTIQNIAKKADLDDVLVEQVNERVQLKKAANARRTGGKPDITPAEVKEIVRSVKKQASALEERLRLKLQRESASSRREQVKQTVKKARRPVPPGPRSPAPARPRKMEVPKGVDPLDFAIDRASARILNRG